MKVPEQFRLKQGVLASDDSYGANGCFIIPHPQREDVYLACIVSDQEGWDHVSVTLGNNEGPIARCPVWEEMCFIKDIFWNKDEVVIQYHPAESDYVSCHHFCLHLWKPQGILLYQRLILLWWGLKLPDVSDRPPFLSAPWPRDPSWQVFKVGTCRGQWRATPTAYELLAIINDSPGNGDFSHLMDWFYESCKRDNRALVIREIWNKRLAAHLVRRGFTYAQGDDMVKRKFD